MLFSRLAKNFSIFTKISIISSAVIILTSVLSTFFLVGSYSDEIQKRDRLLVQEAANKLYSYFQDRYNNMYNQRTFIHSRGFISDIIAQTRENPSDIYELETVRKISDYLTALIYSDSSIEDAILFTADGENVFSASAQNGRRIYSGFSFNKLSYIETFRKSPASIIAVYDSSPEYLTISSTGTSEMVITFILKIYAQLGTDSSAPLAYMMVNYSPDSVNESYHDISITSSGDYFVVNSLGDIIYSNTPSSMGKRFESSVEAPLFAKKISLSGIEVIGSLNQMKLMQTTLRTVQTAVLITGAGVLVMIPVIFILHRYYAKKFHHLAVAMKSISTGDFSTRLSVASADEIGYLSETFNQMSQTLRRYIDKTYLAETKRRTAELYALQAQINPHFLANTIESIRMCALGNDDYESAEMMKKLGNLFRWMIQFDHDIIYVENEMEYTESYLDLMRFRFMEKLSVNIEMPPDIYILGIPRFTLQPILENSLALISPHSQKIDIRICFSVDNGKMDIVIKDNGPGIEPEKLKQLNSHIRGEVVCTEFGVALKNIHSRITLLFGPRYGLTIDSISGTGTTVTVCIPAQSKKEMEKYVQVTHS